MDQPHIEGMTLYERLVTMDHFECMTEAVSDINNEQGIVCAIGMKKRTDEQKKNNQAIALLFYKQDPMILFHIGYLTAIYYKQKINSNGRNTF